MENLEKVYNFLKEVHTFFFASVEDGAARVRPFGFCAIVDGKLYFGMGKHKASYRQAAENPNVVICSCRDREWLRIRGKAVFDWNPETEKKIFAMAPFLEKMYGPESDLTFAPFYLEDMEAEYANMQGAFEKWI